MLNKALKTIEKYKMLKDNDIIVIGLSGGADSVALTHLLYTLSESKHLSLICVHINHMLRGQQALSDQKFVEKLCGHLKLPLEIFTVDVKQYAKRFQITVEEAGRQIRYEAFNTVVKNYNATKIAVAHNKNDHAETILFRLLRGTGLRGLGGIRAVRDNIIRPLIECGRDEIEEYCGKNNMAYCIDYTNLEEIYTRNKIRLNMLPWIKKELNENIVETLSKTAEILALEDDFLDKLSKRAFEDCSEGAGLLSIEGLSGYEVALRRRIVRYACLKYNTCLHDISHEHVNMILSLMNGQTGKTVMLPRGLRASRRYNNIFIYNEKELTGEFSYTIPMNEVFFIKELQKNILITDKMLNFNQNHTNRYTKIFDYDRINSDFILRTRKEGDKIYFKGINGHKKVKNLFIDSKIPRDERMKIPVLCHGEDCMWVVGLGVSDLYSADDDSRNKFYVHIWEEARDG